MIHSHGILQPDFYLIQCGHYDYVKDLAAHGHCSNLMISMLTCCDQVLDFKHYLIE